MLEISIVLVIIAVVAFGVTYAMVPASVRLAKRIGAVDEPGERRIHTVPTPRMGGVAIFSGICVAYIAAFVLSITDVIPLLGFPLDINPWLVGLSMMVIFAVGCIDDVRQIGVGWKLLGQVVAACIAVAGGVILTDIHADQAQIFVAFGIWAYPFAVFYLVAFANIINLIDGLDGLAAGVSAISGAAFLIISCQMGMWATASMAVALVAACLAFLRFNFHPAKLFMGDCGSLTLGFVLGLVSLMGTMRVSSLTSLVVPLVIAAIPVLDTLAAIIRRRRKRVSIGKPDKEHIHHSLLKLGFSQRRVVLTIYAICAVFAISGVVIAGSSLAVRFGVLIGDVVVAAILVWRLGLFGKVMGRYYPDGKPRNLSRTILEMRARSHSSELAVEETGLKPVVQSTGSASRQGKLRILLLCEHFAPGVDACAKRMTVMVNVLQENGHEAEILASESSLAEAPDGYEVPDNVHFYPVFKMHEKTVINRLKNNLSEAYGSKTIAKSLGEFDVLVVSSPPLMLTMSALGIARRAGARLVFDVRDIWPDVAYEMGSFTSKSFYGRVFSFLANRTYRKADLITTVSQAKADKLRMQLPPPDAVKVRLVANGLDLDFLQLEERPEMVSAYELDHRKTCVYVGNLGLAQGLSTLLSIAEARKDVQFLLFGSGAEKKLLAQRIAERNLSNAKLCGRTDARGVRTLLTHATCAYVCLKNSNMVDSVPTKLFEALGCGCPVLLAAVGDSADILAASGLGVSVAPEDKQGLLAAFDEVMAKEWTPEMRQAASLYIQENHSRQASAKMLENILVHEFKEPPITVGSTEFVSSAQPDATIEGVA